MSEVFCPKPSPAAYNLCAWGPGKTSNATGYFHGGDDHCVAGRSDVPPIDKPRSRHRRHPVPQLFLRRKNNRRLLTGDNGNPVHHIGLIASLGDKNVSFSGYVAPFSRVDAANVYFHGTSQNQYGMSETVDGTLDRVTGALDATITTSGSKTTFARPVLKCFASRRPVYSKTDANQLRGETK